MRALVTGVCGFVGSHVAKHLAARGDEVIGTDRPSSSCSRLESLAVDLRPVWVDLLADDDLLALFSEVRPDLVYHLAGLAGSVGLGALLDANVVCSANVLEAVRLTVPSARVLLVSSAAVYGEVPEDEQPIAEERPPGPVTDYGLSKAAMELLGRAYVMRHDSAVVIARPFNMLGEAAPRERVTGEVQEQLAQIRDGSRGPVVQTGDLSAVRDFMDVDDAAAALRTIAEAGQPGVAYNVCSGVGRQVRDVVSELIERSGLAGVDLREETPSPGVAAAQTSVGDPSRLRALSA